MDTQTRPVSNIMKLMHKLGIKNEKTANIILIAFVVIAIAVSIISFVNATSTPTVRYNLSPELMESLPSNN